MFKWAAIGDTPPFSETVEFEFDERVNVFIGPNAVGKSTLLRKLAEGEPDLDGDNQSKFDFNTYHGEGHRLRDLAIEGLLEETEELTEELIQQRLDNLGTSPLDLLDDLPLIYIPASRLNIPLSTDTQGIRGMLGELNELDDLTEILFDLRSTSVFNGSLVYRATKKITDGLQLGRYSGRLLRQMLRVSRLPYACAQAICSDVLNGEGEQSDWVQELPIEQVGDDDYVVTTVHHDMAIPTAYDKLDGTNKPVFMGDLSAGTQGTLLWIWYLALRIADFYEFEDIRRGRPRAFGRVRSESEEWEKLPAILLIDEIENHLHPTWQRRVIPALLKYFPGLQIFATTHSPFVIAGLKKGQVHLLSRNEEGTVIASTNEQDIVGWTADEILRTFMGVAEPTDELTATNAQRLRVLRRKDALEGLDDQEQAELEELRTKAGADILARGGMLNAQRERFADMVKEFLKARLADTPPDEASP